MGTAGNSEIAYCESCPADATTCTTCIYGYVATGKTDPACQGKHVEFICLDIWIKKVK